MQAASRKTILFLSVLLVFMILFTQTAPAQQMVKTEKDSYQYGEKIKVFFSSAPGKDSDWICIVPVASPATEPGDYQYLPKGLSQGVLIFDAPPSTGKYEVRAYYNYSRNGYVVSGRHAFTVESSPEGDAVAQRMQRKIDPTNPLEANLSPGSGLLYILWEPSGISARLEVEIKANGKIIAVLPNANYFQYSIPAGNITLSIGSIITRNLQSGAIEETWSPTWMARETTITVMPGYVYYLKVFAALHGGGFSSVQHVPHEEGTNSIITYKMTRQTK